MSESLGRPSPAVLVAHLDGCAVLLDVQSRDYFRLNETGALIWSAIERGELREKVVADLVASFDVSPDGAGEAVDALVAALRQRELLLPA